MTQNTAHHHLAAARQALDAGDARLAYRYVVAAIAADGSARAGYAAAAECLSRMRLDPRLFNAVAAEPDSPQALLALGRDVLAAGDALLAVTIASRAYTLDPRSTAAATVLALAHASNFEPQLGREILARVRLVDFNARHASEWCALLCNDPRQIPSFVESARAELRRAPLPPSLAQLLNARIEQLEECLARWATIVEAPPHVREWHFIQYGTAILDFCERSDATGGRYGLMWDTYGTIANRLRQLSELLDTLNRRPTVVIALADRDSQIMGRAVAEMLGVGYAIAIPENVCQRSVLVVAAHARLLNHAALTRVCAGQTVFAAALNWQLPGAIVPDIAGMLCQSIAFPWSGLRAEHPRPGRASADVEKAVQAILAARVEERPQWGASLRFYRDHGSDLKGYADSQRRLWFQRDSPVPATYWS